MPVSVYDSQHSSCLSNAIRDSIASTQNDDFNSLQSQLEASAKHILLSKIEYEEINNYKISQDSLKSKYIVLKSKNNNANKTLSEKDCKPNGDSGTQSQSPKDARIPAPKRILFPRENIQLGWKSSGRKWKVGSGMVNVGNTCYLNSTLQAIFHVPAVANWLLADSQHKDKCQSSDGCIICVMIDTLIDSQKNDGPIKPWMVYTRLRVICRHLVPGRQEDAHEFLRYLVEAMEKSYLLRFKNSKEFDQYSKETTPLNQILGGYLRSAVKCLACNHISTTFQHFEDILLDIRKSNTIDEALNCYFSRERLEDMGYKCESCKKKVSATKQFYLERAPPVLCIQLKRFSVVGGKLNKHVVIRTKLDLSEFAFKKVNETLSYKLVSMVTHLGASQHCGHYTAIGLTDVGGYYQFDDSCVRPIAVQNVVNTNAYILFYELEDALPSYLNNHNNSTTTKEMTIINENGFGNKSTATSSTASSSSTYNGKDVPSSNSSLLNQTRNTIIKTDSNSSFIGPQLPMHLHQSPSKLVTTVPTTTTNGESKKIQILPENRKINLSNNNSNNSNILNGKNCNDTNNTISKLVNSSTNNNQNTSITINKIPNTNSQLLSTSNTFQINGNGNKDSGKLIKNGITATATTTKSNIPAVHMNGNGVKKWIPVPISNLIKEKISDEKNSLPSMPKLIEEIKTITTTIIEKQKNSDKINFKDNINKQKFNNHNNNNKTTLHNGHNNGFNKPKSLVPYDANDDSDESDDDEDDNNDISSNNNSNHNNIKVEDNNDDNDSSDSQTEIVETKTGRWEVSEVTVPCVSLHGKIKSSTKKKNNHNNIITNGNNSNNNKHKKKNGNNKYEHTNDTVAHLLVMGQKKNISTWNGHKSNLEKETTVEDKRLERKRQYQEDDENEMDRGRVKKIKIHGPNGGRDNPGYNPFQETQLQQNRRWVNGRFYNHTIYKQSHHRNQNFQQRHRNYSSFTNNNNHRGHHQRDFNR